MVNREYRKKFRFLSKHYKLLLVVPDRFLNYRFQEDRVPSAFSILRLPLYFPDSFHLHFFPRIRQMIFEFRPDLVHVEEEPFNLSTTLISYWARRLGCKLSFYTFRNMGRALPFPFGKMEEFVFNHSAGCLCAGRRAKEIIGAKFKRFSDQALIRISPLVGIDPELFCRHDCRQPKFTIGFVGRLVVAKGLWTLLDACRRLRFDYRVVLVGGGALERRIREEVLRSGLGEYFEFIAWQETSELPALYNRFDCLVVPSLKTSRWKEQFGRVIIEAMACEVPVIGSTSGEIPTTIGSGGLIFKAGDSGDLVAKISRLKENPGLSTRLGKRGRERVLALYSHQKVASQEANFFDSLLANSPSSLPSSIPNP